MPVPVRVGAHAERMGLVDRFRALRRHPEEGRAIVEFVFLGVLLLVPLIYLVFTVARVQGASFAVTNAAREAGRAFVTAPSEAEAEARARAAAALAMADFGVDEPLSLTITCAANPCLSPDAAVEIRASVDVTVPLIPDAVAGSLPASIHLDTTQVVTVDRFAALPVGEP